MRKNIEMDIEFAKLELLELEAGRRDIKHCIGIRKLAEAGGVRDEIERLRKAYDIAYQATYQGHSTHWDKKGTNGANCPACMAARKSRTQCDAIIKRVVIT